MCTQPMPSKTYGLFKVGPNPNTTSVTFNAHSVVSDGPSVVFKNYYGAVIMVLALKPGEYVKLISETT